ncbi:hypothetical protein ACFL5A_00675 [Gemmatimonadota bacterium]
MKTGLVFLAALLIASASPLLAQEPRVEDADLPRWVEEDVISFFNDPSTIHFSGRTRIPSSRVILGDVASLGGPFTLAGEVNGDLVVVNGDLVLEEGGSVTGDVLVVGGRFLGEDQGEIAGDLRVFDEPLRYVQRGDQIAPARRRGPRPDPFSSEFTWGGARFTVKAGQNYNRVEGLPVMFGPSIRTGGQSPLRLDLFAIWRTETGLDLGEEDFGYALRAEQSVGGRDRLAFGGTFFSMVEPIEDWGISNLEASLATFILHKDYRDYYEREGWSAYARLRFPFMPVVLKAEYVEEEHGFSPVAQPWSLTNNNDPWRPQTLVAEGDIRYVEGSLTIDTRNHEGRPTDGWFIQASGRRGLGGDLILPAHRAAFEDPAALLDPVEYETDFLTGFLDIRSYNRVSPGSSLNLRGVLGGTLTDQPLPPQYQHSFGGVGSLPGYPLFFADCGARGTERGYDLVEGEVVGRVPVFQSYGCDKMAVFQAEFRGNLFVDWSFGWDEDEEDWDRDWNWYPSIEFSPDWATFFNLGQGWTVDGLGDTATLMDVGVGIYLGDLGVYYAFPLNENENGDRDGNFFIRLSRRF